METTPAEKYSEDFKARVVREVTHEGPHDRLGSRLVRSCGSDGGQLSRKAQERAPDS